MALSKKQLEQITKIINDRILSFMHESLGPRVLTNEEITRLKRSGLLRGGVRNLIADPVKIGRMLSLVPAEGRASLTLKQAEEYAKRLLPQTQTEKRAIEYAQDHAGEYIRGLKDTMVKDARTTITGSALREVREGVSGAVAERRTSSELKTQLFDKFNDRSRDWRRVAFTEMNDAIQHGVGSEIKRNSEDEGEQRVFKRPNDDACQHCLRLYLESDRVTPKIFKLSELADSNVGLKAKDWKPTLGSVHPWCFTDGRVDVFTSSGWVKIKDIKKNDLVLTHSGRFKRVLNIMPSRRVRGEGIVEFSVTERGTRMRVTENHLFMTRDGWVAAKDLNGEEVKCLVKKCKTCGESFVWSAESGEYCSVGCASKDKVFACHTDEARKKGNETLKRLYKSGEIKASVEKAHIATRKMLEDGTHTFQRENHYRDINRNMPKNKTFIEKKVEWFLSESGYEYECQKPIMRNKRDKLGRNRYFFPDFVLGNLVIECDGIHWHDREKDRLRDIELHSLGYEIVRFSEDKIRNKFESVCDEIKLIMDNHNGNYSFDYFKVLDFKHYIGTSKDLYDFEVDCDHSFVARGVVTHNCACQLQVVPDGFGFVTKHVVSEEIEHDGKTYLSGQQVSDDVVSGLSAEEKNKVRKEAILSFTGE